jgi:hypothetical protein
MYPALLHSHSGLRWILLILLVVNILRALSALNNKNPLTVADKKLSLFALIATHLQAVLGFGLYYLSPKVQFSADTMGNSQLRFFTMEHTLMMLIAIVLITFGHRQAKNLNAKGYFWYYFIGLVIMLAAIPWPFRTALGGNWF